MPWLETYKGLDPEQLERRFAVFERFCVPAVAAQTVPFQWLLFLDHETPKAFRDRLDPFVQSDLLVPIYAEGPFLDRDIVTEVLARLSGETQVLITTRLDSDDGIRSDYLARIQRAARRAQDEFLNFPVGLQWWRGRCYLCLEASNPFISRVETRPSGDGWSPQTVHCDVGHDKLIRAFRVRQVLSPPAWLQAVHGANNEREERGVRWPFRRPPPALALGPPDQFALDPLPARLKDMALTTRRSAVDVFTQRWVIEERARVMFRSWRGRLEGGE